VFVLQDGRSGEWVLVTRLRERDTGLRPATIAIDGPAAAGKSTVGQCLAGRLEYLYFDTGVMYRAVTWAALERGISVHDEEAVTALAKRLLIEVVDARGEDGRQYTVLADDVDITWRIREPAVDANVSTVSAYAGVRRALVLQQRRIAAREPAVMVGRDIGTVVLPDADLKIFLNASVEERARRRWREMGERGKHANYKAVLDSMRRRDRIDSSREVSPLRPADDAVTIDTTSLSVEEVADETERLVMEQGGP
jgi:cytidylate kinase